MPITSSPSSDQTEAVRDSSLRSDLILKDSAVIATFSGLGLAAALLMDVTVAFRFGMGASTDALFTALTMPQLMASVLGTTMTPVLVPLFARTRLESGEGRNWRLFSNLANLTLILLLGVALSGVAFSPVIVLVSAPGLNQATRQVAIGLNRVLFLSVALAGFGEVVRAMLNSQRHFAVPAAATMAPYLMGAIVVALAGGRFGIQAAAVGYVLGYAIRILVLMAALVFHGGRYHLLLDVRDPTLKQVGQLVVPLLLAQGLGQGGIWAERFLASFLPVGSISALAYARRMLRALNLATVNSVSNALLPRFSLLASALNFPKLRRSVVLGIKASWGVCAPLAVGVMVASTPLVGLLFGRGAFDAVAVSTAASILMLYMPGLPFMALLQLVVSPHYAFQDTKTPLFIRVVSLAILLLLQLALSRTLGVRGLAVALSLSNVAAAAVAFIILRRRIGDFGQDLWQYGLKIGSAAVIMGLAILLLSWGMATQAVASTTLSRIAHLSAIGALGVTVYSVSLVLLRVSELQAGAALVKTRIIAGLPRRAATRE
jgi:putative peptidoglycan lipid II flippase